jgi:hypothetical protein
MDAPMAQGQIPGQVLLNIPCWRDRSILTKTSLQVYPTLSAGVDDAWNSNGALW